MRELLFGGPMNPRSTDVGLLLFRVFVGLSLALLHGIGKVPPSERFVARVGNMGMPAPEITAWLATLAEFGGGLLLAVGLLTRPAALFVVAHFAIVVLLAHAGDPIGDRELAMFFGTSALLLVLAGPGRYSVDAVIRGRGVGGKRQE